MFGVAGDIQNVVPDLERKADIFAIVVQGLHLFFRRTVGAQGSEQYRRPYQGAGFVDMHILQFGNIELFADCRQVKGLATGHAA